MTWLPCPLTFRAPEPDEVHVWRADLSEEIDIQVLAADEKERAERFRLAEDRNRFATRAILRNILGQYSHVPPQSLHFQYTEFGKPFLAPPAIRFNVSHSGDRALLAFSTAHDVGIDIEHLRIERNILQLARAELTPPQYREFLGPSPSAQKDSFYRKWTRNEAAGKALGVGVSVSAGDFGDASEWTLCDLEVGEGYAAAVAVRSPRMRLRLWNWISPA